MIFVVETEERSLYVFKSEAEAIANCEGLDVEAGVWLFWDDSGQPLMPQLSVPNKRGLFMAASGVYSLVPAAMDHHAALPEALDEVLHYESGPPLNSKAGVRAYLAFRTTGADGA